MTNFDDRTIVGQTITTFGVKGQVKIISFCENPLAILDYKPILIEGPNKPVFVFKNEFKIANLLIVRFPSICDKRASSKLIGKKLYADLEKFPKSKDQEFYFSDLDNCVGYDDSEKAFGKVLGIHNFGAGDLLEIVKFAANTSLSIQFNKKRFPKSKCRIKENND